MNKSQNNKDLVPARSLAIGVKTLKERNPSFYFYIDAALNEGVTPTRIMRRIRAQYGGHSEQFYAVAEQLVNFIARQRIVRATAL